VGELVLAGRNFGKLVVNVGTADAGSAAGEGGGP